MMSRLTLLAVLVALAATACGGGSSGTSSDEAPSAPPASSAAAEPEVPAPSDTAEDAPDFPEVVAAAARRGSDNTIRFDVTVSSPYDSPQRYADAWRVIGPDGTVYGIRELLHDHAGEQPFMRSLDGVRIPNRVESVTVEARDLANGWGGTTVDVKLPPPTQ
jgi:hypothetical protein